MSVFSFLQKNMSNAIIRPLTVDDREDLEKIIATDPVGFLHAAEHLEHFGLPAPSALLGLRAPQGFMGIFLAEPAPEPQPRVLAGLHQALPATASHNLGKIWQKALSRLSTSTGAHFADSARVPGATETLGTSVPESSLKLVGAFWLGVNCVPLMIPAEYQQQVAHYIGRHHRRLASIFGHRDLVMGLWKHLKHRVPEPFDLREHQPLLYLPTWVNLEDRAQGQSHPGDVGVPPVTGEVRWATMEDRRSLLKASVSMFIEEVGYDPLERDTVGYARRVDELIRQKRSLVALNSVGAVVFKVDLGLVHADYCQLQGVWLHPDYRGRGLATQLFARTCQLIRQRYPHLSLYVNDYNKPARALYQKTGWIQQTDFATILF